MPQQLNSEQLAAVEYNEGPLIIVAGPGTGKTNTLIHKLAFLGGTNKIDPSAILALSFTRKAVAELRSRLLALTTIVTEISTFHALGLASLARAGREITLIDETLQRQLVRRVARQFESLRGVSAKELLLIISLYKNSPGAAVEPQTLDLVNAYNRELQELGVHDFDDLLLNALELMEDQQQKKYDYILVDEFQDTNLLQYQFLQALATKDCKVTVIGDPLQAIYGFRGGQAGIFDLFRQDYSKPREIVLTRNYRSSENIILASHDLFPDAVAQHPEINSEGLVCNVTTLNQYSEADFILKTIAEAIGGTDLNNARSAGGEQKLDFSDFAVLYRVHNRARVLEQKLQDSGIPFQIAGEGNPFDIPEVAALIVALRYLHSHDEADLWKLLQLQAIKLPDKLTDQQGKQQLEKFLWTLIEQHSLPTKLSSNLSIVLQAVKKARDTLANKNLSRVADDMLTELTSTLPEAYPRRQLELQQFRQLLLTFTSLANLIDYFDSIGESEFYDPAADRISLLTIHAAKGLEFHMVFVIGCEEGTIPYSGKGTSDLEEEKRLLYVALTRAKFAVYLTSVQEQNGKPAQASQFLVKFLPAHVQSLEDPASKQILKKRSRQKQKKSQISLL